MEGSQVSQPDHSLEVPDHAIHGKTKTATEPFLFGFLKLSFYSLDESEETSYFWSKKIWGGRIQGALNTKLYNVKQAFFLTPSMFT